ncbi:hypothetical protein UlMin_040913 [Ulmus minor]
MASSFTFSLFSITLSLLTFISLCNSQQYLKLPLLHKTPFTTPLQALSSDSHRLSVLRGRPSLKSPVVSGASTGSGEYFVDLTLGTPPQKLLLVADTGSDLVWVRCTACKNCTNHRPGSAFLARRSSTFSPHHCYDSTPCRYDYSYADGSTSSGFFSEETMSFRTSSEKNLRLKSLKFGCAFRNAGPSVSGGSFNGAQGVMGLGRGPISFSSQLGRRFGNRFSYCLMDYTISPPPTSYLMIGGNQTGVVSKIHKLSFTPLLSNPLSPTFYYIGIKSVSVAGRKLPIDPSVWSIDGAGNGGTIVDSGTTLTFLAEPAYRVVLAAFRRRVKLPSPVEPVPGFDLCVNVSGVSKPSLPRLSIELGGKSVLSPPPRNYFIELADRVKCLAVQPANPVGGFSVIGNLMQQGFLFEFDRDRERLGFTRRGCAQP